MTTMYGTNGEDVLTGTNDGDTLFGYDSRDVLNGGNGYDDIYGGDGNDILAGGNGVDYIDGGEGFDIISFNVDSGDADGNGFHIDLAANRTYYILDNGTLSTEDYLNSIEGVYGSTRDDDIFGNGENNLLAGGGGRDDLHGRGGNDILVGGGDVDRLYGGAGVDTVNYSIDEDDANGYGGTTGFDINLNVGLTRRIDNLSVLEDELFSIENAIGSDVNDQITGTDGDNLLVGGGGQDVLVGRDGNDILAGGGDVDRLYGGAGVDTVSYSVDVDDANGYNESTGFDINLSVGLTRRLGDLSVLEDELVSIENAIGSDVSDRITGTDGRNVLIGGNGTDTLVGRGGADILAGGNGVDHLHGDGGEDIVAYNLDVGDRDTGVEVDLANGITYYLDASLGRIGTEDYLHSIEHVIGSDRADILRGDDDDNLLGGQAGNDIIDAGKGNDVLIGDHGLDSLYGGEGVDTVRYNIDDGGSYDSIEVDLEIGQSWYLNTNLNRVGVEDYLYEIENVTGSDDKDLIYGDSGANILRGEAGNDVIHGRDGDDTLVGGTGVDTISGGKDNDIVDGGVGVDTLDGGEGQDLVSYQSAFTSEEHAVELDLEAGQAVLHDHGTASSTTAFGVESVTNFENAVGSSGDDVLRGTAEANLLSGGDGIDRLEGRDGNDTLIGGNGSDILDGGADADTVSYADEVKSVIVDLKAGTGITRSELTEVLLPSGSEESSAVTGQADLLQFETINSDAFPLIVNFEKGVDKFDLRSLGISAEDITIENAFRSGVQTDASGNYVWGTFVTGPGLGGGLIIYENGDALGDFLDLDDFVFEGQTVEAVATDTLINIEHVVGGAGDDTLRGDDKGNILSGNDGNDILEGRDGSDILIGGAGNDVFDGGKNFDTASFISSTSGVQVDFAEGRASQRIGDNLVTNGSFENNGWSGSGDFGYTNSLYGWTLSNQVEVWSGLIDGFASTPIVLTSVMSANGGTTVDSDPSNVTSRGFDLSLQEEEAQDGIHARETVGWIAVEVGSGANSGLATARSGIDENTSTVSFNGAVTDAVTLTETQTLNGGDTATVVIDSQSDSSVSLHVQEEQSEDTETNHSPETVGVVSFGDGLIRGESRNGEKTIGEAGSVSVSDYTAGSEIYIALTEPLEDPVIALTGTSNGVDPYTLRIVDQTVDSDGNTTAFSFVLEEWEYLDGDHSSAEDINWLAVESGSHTLEDGRQISAGTTTATHETTTVSFAASDGEYLVELDNSNNATLDRIAQVLNVEEGQTYELSFDLRARGSGTETVEVWWGGQLLQTVQVSEQSWQTITLNLPATASDTSELAFREVPSENNGSGPLLDNVQVYRTEVDTLVSIEAVTGSANNDVLLGDSGDNVLQGEAGNDVLEGRGGADRLSAGAGHDLVKGGEGDDLVVGAAGRDDLQGETGSDILLGGADDDVISGGENADVLSGGFGNDILDGSDGTDTVHYSLDAATTDNPENAVYYDAVNVDLAGGTAAVSLSDGTTEIDKIRNVENVFGTTGNDTILGDSAANELRGLEGADTLRGEGGSDRLFGGDGNDDLHGGTGSDYLSGGSGADELRGGAENDVLLGGAGVDFVFGGDHDDVLSGGYGNDTLDGSAGIDTVHYGLDSASKGETDAGYLGVHIDLATGSATVSLAGGSTQTDTLIGIENAIGTEGDDVISGTDDANTLTALTGHDNLLGLGGDDFLDGSGLGGNLIDGGVDTDTVTYQNHAELTDRLDGVTIDLQSGKVQKSGYTDTLVSIENATGSGNGDILRGNDGANRLDGHYGNDIVSGGYGNDNLSGGTGDDLLSGGYGADVIDGGEGIDLVSYSLDKDTTEDAQGVRHYNSVSVDLTDGVATVTLNDGTTETDTLSNIESALGTAGDDQLTGDTSDNTLIGMRGDDTISGGDGNDVLSGGRGNDSLSGGSGTDTVNYSLDAEIADESEPEPANIQSLLVNLVTGSASVTLSDGTVETDTLSGIENLIGSEGTDTLVGDAGNNQLAGLNGSDTISGGAGNDVISGAGAGSNTLDGGADVDTVSYLGQVGGGVQVDLSAGLAVKSGADTDTLSDFENAEGTVYEDTLTGDDSSNHLLGHGGADTLYGNAGNDTLDGGAGADILQGGLGDDHLQGGTGVDQADYSYLDAGKTVVVDFAVGTGKVFDVRGNSALETDTLESIEGAIGGTGGDLFLAGGTTGAVLDGGASADIYHLESGTNWAQLKFEDNDVVSLPDMALDDLGARLVYVPREGLDPDAQSNILSDLDTTLGIAFTDESTGQIVGYSTLENLGIRGTPENPPTALEIAQGVANSVGRFQFGTGEVASGAELQQLIEDRVEISDTYVADHGNLISTGADDDYYLLQSSTASRSESNEGSDAYDILGGNHILDTGADADTIYVKGGTNDIAAGSGDDTIYLRGGDNTIELGLGSDTVVIDTSTRDAEIRISKWEEGDHNSIKLVGEGADEAIVATDATTGGIVITLHGEIVARAEAATAGTTNAPSVSVDPGSAEAEGHFFTPFVADFYSGTTPHGASGINVLGANQSAGGAGFSFANAIGVNASADGVGVSLFNAIGANVSGSAVSVSKVNVIGANVSASVVGVSEANLGGANLSSSVLSVSGANVIGINGSAAVVSVSGTNAIGVSASAAAVSVYGPGATGLSVSATAFSPEGLPPNVTGLSIYIDSTGIRFKAADGEVGTFKSFGVSAGSASAGELNGADVQVGAVDLAEINGAEIEAVTFELVELEGIGLETFIADVLNAVGIDAEAVAINAGNAAGVETEVLTADALDANGVEFEALTADALDVGGVEFELLTADALDATGLEVETLTLDALDVGGVEIEALTIDAIDATLIEAEVGTIDLLDAGLVEAEAGTVDIADATLVEFEAGTVDIADAGLIEFEAGTVDIADASLVEFEAGTVDVATASLVEFEAATADVASASLVEFEVATACVGQVGVVNIGAAGVCAGKICAGANINVGPDVGPCLGVNIPICPII